MSLHKTRPPGPSLSIMHTASDHKLEPNKALERGYPLQASHTRLSLSWPGLSTTVLVTAADRRCVVARGRLLYFLFSSLHAHSVVKLTITSVPALSTRALCTLMLYVIQLVSFQSVCLSACTVGFCVSGYENRIREKRGG